VNPVFKYKSLHYYPTAGIQYDLFFSTDAREQARHTMIDKINTRYGEGTLLPASLLHYPDFSPVIAPAWQPTGPRQSLYACDYGKS